MCCSALLGCGWVVFVPRYRSSKVDLGKSSTHFPGCAIQMVSVSMCVMTRQRLKNLLSRYALQNPWIPEERAYKIILWVQVPKQCRFPNRIHSARGDTRGRMWKPAGRGRLQTSRRALLLSLLDYTDSLTINTQKPSSKCSGVRAYGAFDFICV